MAERFSEVSGAATASRGGPAPQRQSLKRSGSRESSSSRTHRVWSRNPGQLPRSGEATTSAARSTHLLHFGFQVHAGRRRGSIPRPRSPLRKLRRRCRCYSACALELPQPGSAAGPGTKRPWQPMAAGQRWVAANQRAPHAPSRPELASSKVRGGAARGGALRSSLGAPT